MAIFVLRQTKENAADWRKSLDYLRNEPCANLGVFSKITVLQNEEIILNQERMITLLKQIANK